MTGYFFYTLYLGISFLASVLLLRLLVVLLGTALRRGLNYLIDSNFFVELFVLSILFFERILSVRD